MYSMIQNEVSKINFIISETILAMSQHFLHNSTMCYFYFVITNRNNDIVNSTFIDYGLYRVHQPTVVT